MLRQQIIIGPTELQDLNPLSADPSDGYTERRDTFLLHHTNLSKLPLPMQQGSQSSSAAVLLMMDRHAGQCAPIRLQQRTRGLGHPQTTVVPNASCRQGGRRRCWRGQHQARTRRRAQAGAGRGPPRWWPFGVAASWLRGWVKLHGVGVLELSIVWGWRKERSKREGRSFLWGWGEGRHSQ